MADPTERAIARTARCFGPGGRLVRWPSKRQEQLLALWVVWSQLPADTRWSEAEISSTLAAWHDFSDYALVRRDLVDLGLLQRTPNGAVYRRAGGPPPEAAQRLIARIEAGERGTTHEPSRTDSDPAGEA